MITMTFRKPLIIAILEKNLAEHQTIFLEAVEGYRAEAIKQLEDHIDRVRGAMTPLTVNIGLAAPENHEKDYKAILSMLKLAIDDEIEFTDEQYRCYMLDEWDWQRHFLRSNSGYSQTATGKLGR